MERTAEDWGRVAVSLPGWRWMPGMLACLYRENGTLMGSNRHGKPGPGFLPDPDDPATGGCLLVLLGGPDTVAPEVERYVSEGPFDDITSLGRACIAAAEALGRWPGGAA